ncbi:MAG TPA: NUDIX domain-containing protein [Candidatus Blautia excrementipullorum]|nr:NUDIX domain-containing protein [Candidatus Blautia excrementipullorum]
MYKVFGHREKGQYYNREGAYLITFSGGQTAVVRTPRGYFLLGGGIQGNESDEECLRRECLEECGYTCTAHRMVAAAETYCVHERKGLFHPIQRYYYGTLNERIQCPVEEDHEFLWMDYDAIRGKMYSEMQNWALEQCWNMEMSGELEIGKLNG